MTDSIRGQIIEATKARLETITTANGYDIEIEKVFADEIPMGLDIKDDFLPAIMLIDSVDAMTTQLKQLKNSWNLEIQL